MVGGMVSNNSSGMCCGVSQNTYHTLKDMRVVFVDGTVLDTADPASRESFLQVKYHTSPLHRPECKVCSCSLIDASQFIQQMLLGSHYEYCDRQNALPVFVLKFPRKRSYHIVYQSLLVFTEIWLCADTQGLG